MYKLSEEMKRTITGSTSKIPFTDEHVREILIEEGFIPALLEGAEVLFHPNLPNLVFGLAEMPDPDDQGFLYIMQAEKAAPAPTPAPASEKPRSRMPAEALRRLLNGYGKMRIVTANADVVSSAEELVAAGEAYWDESGTDSEGNPWHLLVKSQS